MTVGTKLAIDFDGSNGGYGRNGFVAVLECGCGCAESEVIVEVGTGEGTTTYEDGVGNVIEGRNGFVAVVECDGAK